MTTTETGTARPAGRPRSEKAEKAIIEATLDLMGEGMGVSELSIEAIASRAGVGKTTIYRRWSNKEDLVADALASLKAPVPPLAGVSVRDDLVALLDTTMREAGQARTRCVMNIAMSESDRYPELFARFMRQAVEPRTAAMTAVIERGMRTGELRADLDTRLALGTLSGTMMWHIKRAKDDGDLPDDLPARIVDSALRGLAP